MVENKELSIIDLIIDTHVGLKRQGPGSDEMTIKALSYIDGLQENSQILDIGCGTGWQTIILANNAPGNIIGLDLFPNFVNVLNENAKSNNLQNRINGIVGSMENLPFNKEQFDLIWCEGAIDNIGFEKGLTYWYDFLKYNGYIAVTSPTWFTTEHPDEVNKFWLDAGSSGLDEISKNISVMQNIGYKFIATFILPEKCWTDNYFNPREHAIQKLLEKYSGNSMVEGFIENNRHEVELYSKYKQYYGYAFFIGKKYK
ncbi:MAG: class I SAM-dependent methyltransferase [Prevotellaceae bacterium]|jgi:ubiquinone/menaquinone biosynthesis C-methylase UbiE|nr:class I SAM-dependent methyltransferase [Prevotellaceae bacterium]